MRMVIVITVRSSFSTSSSTSSTASSSSTHLRFLCARTHACEIPTHFQFNEPNVTDGAPTPTADRTEPPSKRVLSARPGACAKPRHHRCRSVRTCERRSDAARVCLDASAYALFCASIRVRAVQMCSSAITILLLFTVHSREHIHTILCKKYHPVQQREPRVSTQGHHRHLHRHWLMLMHLNSGLRTRALTTLAILCPRRRRRRRWHFVLCANCRSALLCWRFMGAGFMRSVCSVGLENSRLVIVFIRVQM